MRTIYKYPLNFVADAAEAVLSLPAGYVPRRFAMQDDTPTLWAEVDTTARTVAHTFRIFGTGHPVPENAAYLGTCEEGPWVWHLFQILG